MYAQSFFRPIQDLSEKFNILQAAMAASERVFQLLDEPVTIISRPRRITFRPARRNRIPQRLVRLYRRGKSKGRKLGPARRFLPRRTRTDARDRRPHGRRQDHDHPASPALLRHPARPYPARWRGYSRDGSARIAPSVRHRAPGSLPFHRHAGIECEAGHRKDRPRGDRAIAARSRARTISRFSARAWRRPSPSAVARFPSGSASS